MFTGKRNIYGKFAPTAPGEGEGCLAFAKAHNYEIEVLLAMAYGSKGPNNVLLNEHFKRLYRDHPPERYHLKNEERRLQRQRFREEREQNENPTKILAISYTHNEYKEKRRKCLKAIMRLKTWHNDLVSEEECTFLYEALSAVKGLAPTHLISSVDHLRAFINANRSYINPNVMDKYTVNLINAQIERLMVIDPRIRRGEAPPPLEMDPEIAGQIELNLPPEPAEILNFEAV